MPKNLGNLFINGESTIKDRLGTHIVTTTSGVTINSSIYSRGSSSMYFDGSTSGLTIPDHSDFDLGSNDFTIDCWLRLDNTDNYTVIARQWDAGDIGWSFQHNYTNDVLAFYWSTDGTTHNNFSKSLILNDNTWYHLAVVRNDNDLKFFVNGTQLGITETLTDTIFNSNSIFSSFVNSIGDSYGEGYLDNLRLVNGTALWTENFDSDSDDELFYYVRPDNITGLYNIGSRGILRGKASEGFIRPTIKQFFTSENFEEIESILERAHIMAGHYGADNMQYTPDTWVTKTSLPFLGGRDQRYGQSGTAINNKGYIFSGSNGVTNWNTVHEYTLNLDTWTTKATIPYPARTYSTSTTILDKGYVFGGYSSVAISDNDEYTPDTWAARTNIPTTIYTAASTTILDKGYLFTGYTSLQSNYEYTYNTWATRTSLPAPGRYFSASTTALDKGYVFGGCYTTTKFADNDEYTFNTWVSKTDVPTPPRNMSTSTTINNKCYLVGGLSTLTLADNDEYALDTWTAMADSIAGTNRLQTGMTLIG